jgi:hypothetical protein
VPKGAPAFWRIYTDYFESGGGEEWIEIRNASSQKLHIVGLATRVANASFVDLNQPGAFNLSLYPGERRRVDADRDSTFKPNTMYYLKIQDWAVE